MANGTPIVNVALRRCGVTRLISLETDQTTEARIARDVYNEARKSLLNQHTWKFAKKRAQLTASATAPAFGRTYAYILPADFIRLVSIHPNVDDETTCPYKLEYQEGDDRVVLADSATLYAIYIFDLQDADVWSAAFRDLMAFRLTIDIAAGLNRPIDIKQFNDQKFTRLLARAKSIDGMEDFPERMAGGSWTDDREDDPTQNF